MMIEPSPSAAAAASVAGPPPSRKKKRSQHKSSSNGPAHLSSDGRPSSRDHDAAPRPISVTKLDGGDGSSRNAVHQLGSSILFGHARPSPGRAIVSVMVTNTDEHGFTTSTTSTSDTVPCTVSTDWLDRPFVFPPRKLIANPQNGGQPFPSHHAPMPVNGQQFRQNNPPRPMHPHNNQVPYPGNQAPTQFINMAPGPAPFHNNHGQSISHPVRQVHTQPFHPQPSWNTHHPTANHPQQNPPLTHMVAPPAARFHLYNQALSHRVHASDALPPDFRVVNSTPIRFDPSACVQAAEAPLLQH